MSYQSVNFIIFSAAVLLVYYLVGRKQQKRVLLAANLVFYILAGAKYLPFILVTMFTTFFAGKKIGKIYKLADIELETCTDIVEKKRIRLESKAQAKRMLILALVVALGLLAVCKYALFTAKNINVLLGIFNLPQIQLFEMLLPLGISFYTFMALSYVLDIYWKRYEAERNFVWYAVYLSYYPHVVQGPINRFNSFKPQIANGVALSYKNITFGAQLAIWGFFKKLVIADRLGIFVSTIYDNWSDYTGIIFVIAAIFYAIQIYADFSGCMDIVSGISEMFGIKLTRNFDHPFFSKTIPEFWRRWHISLGEWFRDYLYFPISTSSLVKKVKKQCKERNKKQAGELFASCFSAFVVWTATGIWHGASWNFVFWGLYNAALFIAGILFSDFNTHLLSKFHIRTKSFSWKLFQMIRTFTLCCIGRVFSRADGLLAAINIWRNTFKEFSIERVLSGNLFTYGLDRANFQLVLVAIFIFWAVDMLQEHMSIRETLAEQNIVFRWAVIYAGIFAVIIFGAYGPSFNASDFIYGQF
ncbi:MAG: MBOAT family O-acyltransferase [Acetivibrionales bacterium]|jgi:alginate O-acetyltransferase complex protein AlgI